jgi:hypothetical protein
LAGVEQSSNSYTHLQTSLKDVQKGLHTKRNEGLSAFNEWYDSAKNTLSVSKEEAYVINKNHWLDYIIWALIGAEAIFAFYLVLQYFGDADLLSIVSGLAIASFTGLAAYAIKKLPKMLTNLAFVFPLYLGLFIIFTVFTIYYVAQMRTVESLDSFVQQINTTTSTNVHSAINDVGFNLCFIFALMFLGAILEYLVRRPVKAKDAEEIVSKHKKIDEYNESISGANYLINECSSRIEGLRKVDLKYALNIYQSGMEDKWLKNREMQMRRTNEILDIKKSLENATNIPNPPTAPMNNKNVFIIPPVINEAGIQ